ncbi:hypothetical protein ARMSODRAFT_369879 [Armillaria solidipes]|uniref:Uncharacterized protein n=1 Tax=Armillaria solidipes TaxID=1076256 RepID=A0A2H3BSS8_9AGAR|nr:hypothetical protein ARMSODRAFT_369879 [Armillaria solidipes]
MSTTTLSRALSLTLSPIHMHVDQHHKFPSCFNLDADPGTIMQAAAQSPSFHDHWWPSPPSLILVICSISVVILGRQRFGRCIVQRRPSSTGLLWNRRRTAPSHRT